MLDNEAREQARFLELGQGETRGPLYGVPVAIKEELDVAGCVTTFGGHGNSTPAAADGEVVRRLREAGAVIVGKTQMSEFGAWPYTESVAYGYTRNPWRTGFTPGGSSGGTAAAVASGMVPIGMGGDGGGSIRIPAAFCGLFGLKPQRGRVTTSPMEHLWWSLGTVGPLTRTVLDSAIVYDVIRGNLPTDRWRAGEVGSFVEAARREPGRLRIGWTVKPVTKGVKPHAEHVAAVRDTARAAGRPRPRRPRGRPALPRPDHRVRATVLRRHPDRGRRGRALRPARATYPRDLPARLLGDAEGDRASRSGRPRRSPRRPTASSTGSTSCSRPSTAHRPPRVGVLDGTGSVRASLKAMPAIAYAALWNLAGNPACNVPSGTGADGLPLGVQLVGRTDGEETLLSLAAQLEAARPWPLVAP